MHDFIDDRDSVDELFIQTKTLSDKIAHTVIRAYLNRFRRFDDYEKTVMLNSMRKTIMTFLASLKKQERDNAIQFMIIDLENIMYDTSSID